MRTVLEPPTVTLPLIVLLSINSQLRLSSAIEADVHVKGEVLEILVRVTDCSFGFPPPITALNVSLGVESETPWPVVEAGLAGVFWIAKVD